MGRYRLLDNNFDRIFRNNLNENFEDVDKDIQAVESRVSNIVSDSGDSNIEIVDARQGKDGEIYTSLRDHTNAIHTKIDEKAEKTELQAVASGSPKGVYPTLYALQSSLPTGGNGIYVVTADGNWYYWNGSYWAAGGIYQSTGLSPKSVDETKFSDSVYTKLSKNQSAQQLQTGTTNLVYGSDGSKTIEEIKAYRDTYVAMPTIGTTVSITPEKTFQITSDSVQAYFFRKFNCVNDLAPGKKISLAVKVIIDNAGLRKEYRFLDSTNTPIQIGGVSLIQLENVGDGWFIGQDITVPPNAVTLELRMDYRTGATGTSIVYTNSTVMPGRYLSKVDQKMKDDIAAAQVMAADALTKAGAVNLFPDPLIKSIDWGTNLSPSSVGFGKREVVNGKGLFVLQNVTIAYKEAFYTDLKLSDYPTILPGDTVRFENNIYAQTVNGLRPGDNLMLVIAYDANNVELGRKATSPITTTGSYKTDFVIPANTSKLRLRWDLQVDTAEQMASVYYKIDYISLSKVQNGANSQLLMADMYTTRAMIDKAVSGVGAGATFHVSTTGDDTKDGKTEGTAFATFSRAIAAGATIIIAERGDYYNVSFSATGLKEITILPRDHATFDQAKPDGKMINLYGGEKLSPASWVTYNAIYKQPYAGNTYYTDVFVNKTLPIDTGGTRPSYNAFLWEDNKKLVPKLTIAEVEATPGSFTYDGTNVYVNPYAGSIPIASRVYVAVTKGSVVDVSKTRKVVLQDVEAKFATKTTIVAQNIKDLKAQNCAANYSGQANGWSLDSSNGLLIDCEGAWNRNDGFNIHDYGDTVYVNCSGHDNEDDGISHHDGCTGYIYGGEWYNNGKGGIIPTYGAIVHTENAVCYNNVYGVYYGGTKGVTPRRSVHVSNILCYGNKNAGLYVSHEYDVKAYNCVLKDNVNGAYAESNGSLELYSSDVTENTSLGVANAGELTVKVKDCKLSDNKRNAQMSGTGELKLSRNQILYGTTSGIQLVSGNIIMEKRNNVYGNSTAYEGSISQNEKDKNVSIPAI
ncbi:right-handed parallel beta-helix repeat-containing protein [Bacillus sp. 3103sda1]|uniref:right-handed parallel beta-helix repeat-containing protein n=1 Tax=Bacillus sp. 3103sda1 TaxID=2953808 RepID=UPI0020A21624|nr:right-handed parallel beta-helix repeat-containing protein [Bacillus sp. 3103sda1]MCP1124554.1 right-handed parallel beta-helix repeat-containing protein [Bacillus sp. 3103sda1]